ETRLVPLDGSAPSRVVARGRARPSFSPDGAAIWTGDGDTSRRIDLASGAAGRTLRAPPGTAIMIALELPDGRVAARLLDRETQSRQRLALYAGNKDDDPAILYDGKLQEVLFRAPNDEGLVVSNELATSQRELVLVPTDGRPPVVIAPSGV